MESNRQWTAKASWLRGETVLAALGRPVGSGPECARSEKLHQVLSATATLPSAGIG